MDRHQTCGGARTSSGTWRELKTASGADFSGTAPGTEWLAHVQHTDRLDTDDDEEMDVVSLVRRTQSAASETASSGGREPSARPTHAASTLADGAVNALRVQRRAVDVRNSRRCTDPEQTDSDGAVTPFDPVTYDVVQVYLNAKLVEQRYVGLVCGCEPWPRVGTTDLYGGDTLSRKVTKTVHTPSHAAHGAVDVPTDMRVGGRPVVKRSYAAWHTSHGKVVYLCGTSEQTLTSTWVLTHPRHETILVHDGAGLPRYKVFRPESKQHGTIVHLDPMTGSETTIVYARGHPKQHTRVSVRAPLTAGGEVRVVCTRYDVPHPRHGEVRYGPLEDQPTRIEYECCHEDCGMVRAFKWRKSVLWNRWDVAEEERHWTGAHSRHGDREIYWNGKLCQKYVESVEGKEGHIEIYSDDGELASVLFSEEHARHGEIDRVVMGKVTSTEFTVGERAGDVVLHMRSGKERYIVAPWKVALRRKQEKYDAAMRTLSMDEASDPLRACQCPLTLMRMEEPVVASDGNTYEREAIERVMTIAENQGLQARSPLTRQQLKPWVVSNRALADLKVAVADVVVQAAATVAAAKATATANAAAAAAHGSPRRGGNRGVGEEGGRPSDAERELARPSTRARLR